MRSRTSHTRLISLRGRNTLWSEGRRDVARVSINGAQRRVFPLAEPGYAVQNHKVRHAWSLIQGALICQRRAQRVMDERTSR